MTQKRQLTRHREREIENKKQIKGTNTAAYCPLIEKKKNKRKNYNSDLFISSGNGQVKEIFVLIIGT